MNTYVLLWHKRKSREKESDEKTMRIETLGKRSNIKTESRRKSVHSFLSKKTFNTIGIFRTAYLRGEERGRKKLRPKVKLIPSLGENLFQSFKMI